MTSIADLFFAVAYTAKILPLLHIPVWMWIWTAVIAAIKVLGIFIISKKERRLFIEHSFANKLTGFLLFVLPITARFTDVKNIAVIVCATATFAEIEELYKLK